MMKEMVIYEKLDNLYRNENSKKFIDHLIKSYIPKSKIEKVVEKPKGRFRCAITNVKLVAIEDVFKEIGEDKEKQNQFIEHVSSLLDDSVKPAPKLDIFKTNSLALTAKSTDTFLSQEAFHIFFKWIQKKMLEGDKHIYWVIKQMQAEEEFFIKRVKINDEEKIKFINKKQKVKATFGDLTVLQELKKHLKHKKDND